MEENEIEYRSADIAPEADAEMVVAGYAVTFGEPTCLGMDKKGRKIYEVIDPGAIDDRTDMSDVVLRYNHADTYGLLARTKNNTLQLSVDDRGLKVRGEIAQTSQGKDVYELIKRGDVDKMSFAFKPDKISYDYDTNTRHIRHIALVKDVSAVDLPAYKSTSLGIAERALDEHEAEILKEQAKKRLYIRTYF